MLKINDNNKWFDFLEGNSQVAKTEVILSREKAPNGMELIHVSVGDHEIYQFWHNAKEVINKEQPKHIGGKKPYILVMTQQIDSLKARGIKNVEELVGFLVCLGSNIEWHTGRLIHKRSKKQLKYTDLQKVFSCGKPRLDKILKDLQVNNLLSNTAEGYFICKDLIKKGK